MCRSSSVFIVQCSAQYCCVSYRHQSKYVSILICENKMADSLPLRGSNLKLKTKYSASIAMPSTQANTNCVDRHQNDPIKPKKSIKNEKFGKNSAVIKESSKTTALISSSTSPTVTATATTTSAPSSISSYQVNLPSTIQYTHTYVHKHTYIHMLYIHNIDMQTYTNTNTNTKHHSTSYIPCT